MVRAMCDEGTTPGLMQSRGLHHSCTRVRERERETAIECHSRSETNGCVAHMPTLQHSQASNAYLIPYCNTAPWFEQQVRPVEEQVEHEVRVRTTARAARPAEDTLGRFRRIIRSFVHSCVAVRCRSLPFVAVRCRPFPFVAVRCRTSPSTSTSVCVRARAQRISTAYAWACAITIHSMHIACYVAWVCVGVGG